MGNILAVGYKEFLLLLVDYRYLVPNWLFLSQGQRKWIGYKANQG